MSFIETPHLLIRTWMRSDATAVEPMFADPEVMRYIGAGTPWSSETTHVMIGLMIERYERDGLGVWPVVLKEVGAIVGECGLQPLPNSSDVELVYLFERSCWGKGIAYEAASAVLGFGFERLARIVAVTRPENARSIALVNRLGMRFEHVVRAYHADLLKYEKARDAGDASG